MVKTKKEKTVSKKDPVKRKKTAPRALKPKKTVRKVAGVTEEAKPKLKDKSIKSSVSEKAKPTLKPALLKPEAQIVPAVIPKIEPQKKETVKTAPIVIEKPPAAMIKHQATKEKPKEGPIKTRIVTPQPPVAPQPPVTPQPEIKEIEVELPITVKDLAIKLQEKSSNIIKSLMEMKIMASINQRLDEVALSKLCLKYKCRIKKAPTQEELALKTHQQVDEQRDLLLRAPIVTIMGHVDHGKTSLLDAIRKTKVAESEHGGITQHIGAYRVVLPHGEITFLDTPGHEAFTAMRARGASVTDIVVLVVAADDGIMPQTQEAIDHARAADAPIIVAINKIDKPQADIDRVKKQLQAAGLTAEDWGGKTITVGVSAKTGQGIDELLEMMLLEAQMLELKANPNRLAKGVVIEAKMEKGRGPVSSLLIQNGTLHLNENIILGSFYGKVRAMFDDHGRSVTSAGPSYPVEVLGISGVPQAGETFFVISDERQAKELAQKRQEEERQQQIKEIKRISLEDLHAQIAEGKLKELKLIIKADVAGSIEAIKDTLEKLNVSEIKLDIIHTGVGNINTSDVILAVASNGLILGFNVEADDLAKELVAKEGIDLRTYNIIYELANDIKAAVEGMLEPKLKKIFLGRAEIKKVFRLSKAGTVAGCLVTKGKVNRNSLVSVIRNGEVVFEGKLSSLKRFKDDIREAGEGFECGMSILGFDAIVEGDIIESYDIQKIARKL